MVEGWHLLVHPLGRICCCTYTPINDEHCTVRLYGKLWDIFGTTDFVCVVFCCEYLHFYTGVQICVCVCVCACAYLMFKTSGWAVQYIHVKVAPTFMSESTRRLHRMQIK